MDTGETAWLERRPGDRVAIRGNLALGRVPPNDVVLPDERVSRRHAIIHAQGEEEFWLVDHGSRNGTFVNDRRVLQPFRLRDGDRIRIGPFTLTFRQPGSEPTTVSTERAALRTLVDLQSAVCWLLVADVEGSTHLGQSLSQEEVAMLFGGWFKRCQEIVESRGGTMNKYLGDGFLAFWKAAGTSAAAIAQVMGALRELQGSGRPRFRFVLHRGEVLLGGGGTLGEDSLSGAAVNFVFRMEKLAGSLGEGCLLSEAAREGIAEALVARPGGEHPVPGFEGRHRFYAL
jgi:class 3 adenylate cyclase